MRICYKQLKRDALAINERDNHVQFSVDNLTVLRFNSNQFDLQRIQNRPFDIPSFSEWFDNCCQAANISWNSIISEKRHEYFVSLADFGDEEFAKSVANMINSTVVAFSKYYPISSLEGFVFDIDYKAALNMNNRGVDSVKEINPTETDEYIGVGMPLAVVSDGQIKTRIVFRASVAVDLVSNDPAVEENAQSVILHMLASCALRGLIAAKFPNQILKPVPDQFEAFLHEYFCGTV